MAKSHLKLVAPSTENRTVTPVRRPNAELRRREYLTDAEIERLSQGQSLRSSRCHHDHGRL
jgi:type 1 fimbriae regulatory protein FimB/type 1 fimbriae regulatory protein FimE